MQIINSASNMPYAIPAETDSQNRIQQRQQTEATLQISASYKVSLSAEAKELNSQQTQANSVNAATENTRQVNPGLEAQNTTRNEQSTSAQMQVAQNIPPDPAAPAEQPTDLNATQPAPAREAAQSTASTSPDTPSASSQPHPTTDSSTSPVAQTVAPQNQNTPQKPAQEAPMAAAGGMSPGKYSINVSV